MKRKPGKYIAFLLLAVFSIPIFYQQIHILLHNALTETGRPVVQKGIFHFDPTVKDCVLCSFETAIFNEESHLVISQPSEISAEIEISVLSPEILVFKGCSSLFRAPPVNRVTL